ncbi:MAG: hypothetical protein RIC55_13060 [Pirellulaceae bacterium]
MAEEGYVFPVSKESESTGLSLRQFYAALAAAGIKASGRNLDSSDIADEAFMLADAMLKRGEE